MCTEWSGALLFLGASWGPLSLKRPRVWSPLRYFSCLLDSLQHANRPTVRSAYNTHDRALIKHHPGTNHRARVFSALRLLKDQKETSVVVLREEDRTRTTVPTAILHGQPLCCSRHPPPPSANCVRCRFLFGQTVHGTLYSVRKGTKCATTG